MASFMLFCPHCNNMLNIEEEWRGMEVSCPLCSKKFTVPGNTSPVAAPIPVKLPHAPAKKRNLFLMIGGAAALFIIVGVVCFIFLVDRFVEPEVNETEKKPQTATAADVKPQLPRTVKNKPKMTAKSKAPVVPAKPPVAGKTKNTPKMTADVKPKFVPSPVKPKIQPPQAAGSKNTPGRGNVFARGGVSGALYNARISSVMSDFRHYDIMSKNIFQQTQNGTYRTVQLLELIARQIGCPSSSVSNVMSDFRHYDIMSKNINQQIQNGTYRTVQLLEMFAKAI